MMYLVDLIYYLCYAIRYCALHLPSDGDTQRLYADLMIAILSCCEFRQRPWSRWEFPNDLLWLLGVRAAEGCLWQPLSTCDQICSRRLCTNSFKVWINLVKTSSIQAQWRDCNMLQSHFATNVWSLTVIINDEKMYMFWLAFEIVLWSRPFFCMCLSWMRWTPWATHRSSASCSAAEYTQWTPRIPLTCGEWEEIGNPNQRETFYYMLEKLNCIEYHGIHQKTSENCILHHFAISLGLCHSSRDCGVFGNQGPRHWGIVRTTIFECKIILPKLVGMWTDSEFEPWVPELCHAAHQALVTASQNDTMVGYWEPLKYVSKLRRVKTEAGLQPQQTPLEVDCEAQIGSS